MPHTPTSTANRAWTIVAAVLALHILPTPFAVYPQLVDKGPTWLGLDSSARMALNFAWMKGLNWGHDIVYTYGPLSFLSTRLGWGIPVWQFILADLFILGHFFLLFRDFILGSAHRWLAAVVVVLITVNLPPFYGNGLAWMLMVFVLYWMYRSHRSHHWAPPVMLALLSALAFYIKLNTGIFIMALAAGNLVLLAATRRISAVKAILAACLLIAMIWLCALLFNVSLPAYVKGAAEVMKGYNDLLYLADADRLARAAILALFFGLFIVMGFCLIVQVRRRQPAAAFFILSCLAYLFLLKKQALFRSDEQHMQEFFFFMPLVLLCGLREYLFPDRQKLVLAGIAALTFLCFAAMMVRQPLLRASAWRLTYRYSSPYRYIKQALRYDAESYTSQGDKRFIPPRILQRIGRGTVDVFPWDANYVFQNKLHFYPRPCFQTFQANTDYLQQINYDFYERKGPDFVIYDYDAIDNAYPFNDAARLHLFLARNYEVVDSFSSNERWRILLQRKQRTAPLALRATGISTARLNQSLSAAAPFLKLQVSYTLPGKLCAMWSKPPPLRIAYQRPNGEWLSYKTSPGLLRSGIYLGRLLRSNQEFAQFAAGDTAGLESIRAVKVIGSGRHYDLHIRLEHFGLPWPAVPAVRRLSPWFCH